MAVIGGIVFIIVGLFCGAFLVGGSTGFWTWTFALGSEILTLFCIGNGFSEDVSDSDSTYPKVMNAIGVAFWLIALCLEFSHAESTVAGWICFAGFFIAPYLIVASLDASFGDSVRAKVYIGIAKLTSSILLYTADLVSWEKASAEFPKKFIAYIVIISFFVLLFWKKVVSKEIVSTSEEKRKKRMLKKEQRKTSCSQQLIFAVDNDDQKAVLYMLEKGADVNYKDFSGKVPLRIAMENNNKNMISLLLEKGAKIEDKDNNGCTLLQSAVENGNLDMASFLLEKGAFINCKDALGQTPLLMALRYNNKNMISFLLKKGAAINIFDSHSKSALDFAIENEDVDLVSLLLENGAEIGDSDSSLKTALDFAIKNSNEDLLSRLAEMAAHEDVQYKDRPLLFYAMQNNYKNFITLLVEKGVDINYENERGQTPLMFACVINNKDMASFLLDKGADINYKIILKIDEDRKAELIGMGMDSNLVNSINSITTSPLSQSIESDNEEMISFLIERGADVNLTVSMNTNTEEFSYTVLQKAINNGNKKIVSLLLDAGAEINKNSKKEGTALMEAVSTANYNSEIVALLIKKGADVNLQSKNNGQTPLLNAILNDNKSAVALLLKNGADPNKKSSKFGSPLMAAFQAVNRKMISLLMKNGADSSEALCVASMMPKVDAAKFLLDNGAEVNCEGLDGNAPLCCAVAFSTKEMVLFLISNGADVNYEISSPSDKKSARTPLEMAIVTGNAEMVSLLLTYGADVNYKTKNGNTPLMFAALHRKSEIVPILKEAGAVSNSTGKSAQTTATAATNRASSDLSEKSTDFNFALVALSKIIAKNGAEIFMPENSQKLKALVSDLIPQENEIAPNLKQALSCNFTQIILDATNKSDNKKEKSFKDAVNKIIAETALEKETAILIVKLVALSLEWNFENLEL